MKPTLRVDLKKLYENARIVVSTLEQYDVEVTSVTKVHGCNPEIVNTLVKAGIKKFGDSRIENLMNIQDIDAEKWLIRIPCMSDSDMVVKYADVSLNSELVTIKALNEAAQRQNKIHKVLMMFDVGDLREGYFDRDDIVKDSVEVCKLSNIEIIGVASNLTCYGGVLPDEKNLSLLVSVKEDIEKAIGKKLDVVSGGNSTTYTLYREGNPVKGVTNIRIGDTIYLGRDDTSRDHIDGMNKDVFTLEAEIIEIKEKPSIPIGKRGQSALNTRPVFTDKGIRKRAILSVGKQDIDMDMFPLEEGLEVLGGSSDHLIVDITYSEKDYKIGDTIKFYMYYTAALRGFTSKYVVKEYINE